MPSKVMGDSLLIHEFTYSLFIGLCSVTSDMTGYSHLSIKPIHCGSSQRDVLSDKMVFSRQESEVRKNDNRIGGVAVSDRYPKPNYLQS